MSSTTLNTRTILVGMANLAALFLVAALIGSMTMTKPQETFPKVVMPSADSLPTTTGIRHGITHPQKRDLRASPSKGSGLDCIPLYPTQAPAKGKGSKGSSNSTSTKGSKGSSLPKGSSSNSTSTKGSKGSSTNSTSISSSTKGSRGNSTSTKGSKGSSSSAAPSYYCSDVPSASPSLSSEPTTSAAPTCESKGSKGKGSCKSGKSGKSST